MGKPKREYQIVTAIDKDPEARAAMLNTLTGDGWSVVAVIRYVTEGTRDVWVVYEYTLVRPL